MSEGEAMGRDRLVDQIAQAMWVGLGENEQSCEWADIPDHWEDRANFLKGAEVVLDSIKKSWTLLPNVDGGWSLTLEDDGPSPVSLDEPAEVKPVCVHEWEGTYDDHRVCGRCGADQAVLEAAAVLEAGSWWERRLRDGA